MEQMKLNTLYDTLQNIKDSFNDFEIDTEKVGIEYSLGRYAAENVTAVEDLPGFNRANVDGYAIISGGTLGESGGVRSIFNQIGQSEAGKECRINLGTDECVYVASGAMIPANADAVIHINDCEIVGPLEVAIEGPVERWENVVCKGDDFKKGEILLNRGKKITAREISAMAGAGFNFVKVFKKLTASIISTGEEIVEPFNSKLNPGQIRDMNSYMISALLKDWGVTAVNMGIARNYARQMEEALEKSLSASDIIIITGGSSIGAKDETLKVIKRIEGVQILTDRIGIVPGSGTIVARAGNKIIFGLPGKPISAMLTMNIIVKPIIKHINKGCDTSFTIRARCLKDYKSHTKKEEYVFVSLEKDLDEYTFLPITGRAGYVTSILNAAGFIKIRPSDDGIKEGQYVEVTLF